MADREIIVLPDAEAVASLGLFVPLALTVLALDRGLLALWAALGVLMVARLLGLGARYRGDRWLVTGAERGRA